MTPSSDLISLEKVALLFFIEKKSDWFESRYKATSLVASPKVFKIGHIMPERYDPSTAPHNHLHDNVSYSFIVNASKSPSHFLFQPFATQDQKSAIRTEKAPKTKQNCETVSVSL